MSKNSQSHIPDALGAGAVSLALVALGVFTNPAKGADVAEPEKGTPYCILTTNGSESKIGVFEKTSAGLTVEKAPQSTALQSQAPDRKLLAPGMTGDFAAPNVKTTIYSWNTKMNGQAYVSGTCNVAGLPALPLTSRHP